MLANGLGRIGLIWWVLWLGWAGTALGETGAPRSSASPSSRSPESRLRGELGADMPTVTLRAQDEPIAEVFLRVARQVGLDLFLADPPDEGTQRITVHFKGTPLSKALEQLLSRSNRYATVRGRVLTVTRREVPFAPALPVTPGELAEEAEEARDEPGVSAGSSGPRAGEGMKPRSVKLALGKLAKGFKRFDPLDAERFETDLVPPGSEVEMAVAIGGPLTVAGTVRGAAVSIGGAVTLLPGALVEGDVLALGGEVRLQRGATALGRKSGLDGFWVWPVAKVLALAMKKETRLLAVFWLQLFVYVLLFLVGALVIALSPSRVAGVRAYLGGHPLLSLLGGILLLATWIGICVLLALTYGLFAASRAMTALAAVIALLGPIALTLLGLLGGTAFFIWIGELLPFLPRKKLLSFAAGLILTAIVTVIPYVGPISQLVVSLLGPGAALLSRLGTHLPLSDEIPAGSRYGT